MPRLLDDESQWTNQSRLPTEEMLEQKSASVVETRTPQLPGNQVGSQFEITDMCLDVLVDVFDP